MTKANIVQRLLDNKEITAEEAVVLLETVVREINTSEKLDWITPGIFDYPNNPPEDDMVPYGTICPCNPANGGSGICNCIMGNKLISRGNGKTTLWTTDGSPCFCSGACKE